MQIRLLLISATAILLAACQESTTQSPTNNTPSAPAASNAIASASSSGSLKSVDIRKDDIGGDFTLTDGNGKPFSLSSLKGKVVILSFGFTNCPDVCPTELFTYSEAIKQLGEQGKDVAVVFVSVDPRARHPRFNRTLHQTIQPKFHRVNRYQPRRRHRSRETTISYRFC